ncbi:MAG: DNA-3-methyladenine glycosylase 2 family protein [Chloroflexi bacterium]|nr:DNA-3-methyladenine glycosylase 2 family protein [Chloroflexota bacterium]
MTLTARIQAPEPFDFDLTVEHQTYYRGRAGADLYADGAYYRALRRPGGGAFAVRAAPAGDGFLDVRLPAGGSASDLALAVEAVPRLLGFEADLPGFYARLASDPVLASTLGALHGLRPARAETVFEALVMAVAAQQISGAVARVIRDGLMVSYGTRLEADGHELHAFPTPEALVATGVDGLRAHKLSWRKSEYIHGIAVQTLEGAIDDERLGAMDDDEAIAALTSVRGVGRWTAQWVLIRALGRPDVLPEGDLALKRVVSELYFGGEPMHERRLAEFAQERWSPYRGLVTTYLFAQLRRARAAAAGAEIRAPGLNRSP